MSNTTYNQNDPTGTPAPNGAVDILFEAYIDSDCRLMTDQEKDVDRLALALDDKADNGEITCADLADYELAARRAGFYAGMKAAMSMCRI